MFSGVCLVTEKIENISILIWPVLQRRVQDELKECKHGSCKCCGKCDSNKDSF